MAENFQATLLDELRRMFHRVVVAAETPGGVRRLVAELGWQPDGIDQFPEVELAAALADAARAFTDQLVPVVQNPPDSLAELPAALGAAGAVTAALVAVGDAASGAGRPDQLADIGKDLVNLVATEYVRQRNPVILPLLELLTLARTRQVGAVPADGSAPLQRLPRRIRRLAPEVLVDLVRDPVDVLGEEYLLTNGLTDPDGTADRLFPRIVALAQALGLPAFYGFDPADGIDLGTFGNARAARMMGIFLPVAGDLISETAGFGLAVALDATHGVIVHPFGVLDVTETIGNWGVRLESNGALPPFAFDGDGVSFPAGAAVDRVRLALTASRLIARDAADQVTPPVWQIGGTTGTRLELRDLQVGVHAELGGGTHDYGVRAAMGAALIVAADGEDGFLARILPEETRAEFALRVGWSHARGLHFGGSGALELTLPIEVHVGGVLELSAIHLGITARGGEDGAGGSAPGSLDVEGSVTARTRLGPVTATAERIGIASAITFPEDGGNLGPANAEVDFKPPTGIGILIEAGAISGGGFLFATPGRYAGALELSIYGVAVKAFGLIETKLPNGASGFSFAIVISAEFTPIQLGLGFTLNGVGGLIGINRRLDETALRDAVRTGSLGHLLFPENVVSDAPAIIADLAAVFPAAEGRHVFGPMAKIGWGTPTIIEAELGIVLELPGPRLALLGEVSALLPKRDAGLVTLNMSVAGLLDFPKKLFAMDASLHDSRVGGYPITGDMAMRLLWGDRPSFALAVGGFNPAFQPPPAFPTLRRVTVDLGVTGNPSLTLQGYFAITSNSAQVGALAELRASGSGIVLSGRVQFDAIFVFSPFAFEARLSAQVRVSFKGRGIGVHLAGTLSGPSPWRVRGKVCVSILFWDACLGFDKSFGSARRVELPSVDVWASEGGLRQALTDIRNWTPERPIGALAAVSLAEPAAGTTPPFDPMGAATVRERVVPLNVKIQRFGAVKPAGKDEFRVTKVELDRAEIPIRTVREDFAPGQFFDLRDSQKLSGPQFQRMDAGLTIDATKNGAAAGSVRPHDVTYRTKVLGSPPDAPARTDALTDEQLVGMRRRSAVARAGLASSGTEAYFDPSSPPRFAIEDEGFLLADVAAFRRRTDLFATALSKVEAILALDAAVGAGRARRTRVQVVPTFELGRR